MQGFGLARFFGSPQKLFSLKSLSLLPSVDLDKWHGASKFGHLPGDQEAWTRVISQREAVVVPSGKTTALVTRMDIWALGPSGMKHSGHSK
jgi:hypothetical protein